MATDPNQTPGAAARALIRSRPVASLATALATGEAVSGWPYVSLVLVACRSDASPILLISRLAEHTRNLAGDNRLSLLFEDSEGIVDPLSSARVTVLGHAHPAGEGHSQARFLSRHPEAQAYAQFADFSFYQVEVERAHLVAGFGRIDWIDSSDLLFDSRPASALDEAEPDILTHMNQDHAEAIQLYAATLLGLDGQGWTMTGCDPEGCDLRRGGEVARLAFDTPVATPGEARVALAGLARKARGT